MKKVRFFFYGVFFLAVLSGLSSARTASSHTSAKDIPHALVIDQVPGAVTVQGSQSPQDLPPPSIRFERFTIADGLSSSKVDAILQDRQGYLWIGTEHGLNKYDGYQFTVYYNDPADPTSLSHDRVYTLYEDSSGELWIGTGAGLDRLDRATNTFVHYQVGLGGNPYTGLPESGATVFAIQEDRRGVLWAGSSAGLYHLDPDSRAPTRSPDWRQVLEIAENSDGQLWVRDFDGLYLYDPEAGQRKPAGLGEQGLRAIYLDPQGDVWVGASDGLWYLDQSTGSVLHYQHNPDDPSSLSDNRVNALFEDRAGRLWVGTFDGLDLFDRKLGRFVHYRYDPANPSSLSDNLVLSLYEDRSGVLWIGTDHGLSKYSWTANRFTLYRQLPDVLSEAIVPNSGHPLEISGLQALSSERVQAVYEDHEGILWIGMFDGGLDRLDRSAGTLAVYRHDPADPNSLSSDTVREIYVDRSGRLWLGTERGLNRFEPDSGTFLKDWGPDQYLKEEVLAITEDQAGELWVGTMANLYSFDRESERFTYYQRPGWNTAPVKSLYADQTGFLWVGSYGRGIYRWDGEQFTPFQTQSSDPANRAGDFIMTIFTDPAIDSGAVWAGSGAGGLLRFDRAAPGAEFQEYTEKDGMVGNHVLCIMADSSGLMWLATNRGVSMFDPATKTFRNYDARDGLNNGEILDCFQSNQGELFLAGFGGVVAFYPEQIKDNAQPPPIAITAFRLLNQAEPIVIPPNGRVELSYQQNDLSLEFAALDFHAPGKNQYAYRLEGVNRDWVAAGTRRYVNYTNLVPGSYAFRVRGSNNDGVWNEEGLTLYIIIHPPFWGTWWFRVLVTAVLLGTMFGVYRLRVRGVEQRSQELEQQVADRTAELSQANVHLEQEIAERQRTEEALAQERAAAAVTAERNRLARELHDAVTQTLFSASLVAQALPAAWEKDPQEGQGLLQDLRGLTRGALAEMRTLLLELRPAALLETRLDDLLRQLGEAASGRVGIPVTVQIEGKNELHQGALPSEVHIALYRVAQEALNNVIKHAYAKQATVRLSYSPGSQDEPVRVLLSISDDGRGFDAAQLQHDRLGFGIMQERVQAIHGILTIESLPGQGTQVTVIWQQTQGWEGT